jgi:hypothetical protein
MNRREAVCALLAVAWLNGRWPARAQESRAKPYRIATLPDFLVPVARDLFIDAMRELGWIEDRDFVIAESGYQYGGAQLSEAAIRVVAVSPTRSGPERSGVPQRAATM